MTLGIINARVLRLTGAPLGAGAAASPLCGPHAGDLHVMERACVLVRDGAIVSVTPGNDGEAEVRAARPETIIDACGRVLMPGFVDAHTHACWAGDRLDEWALRLGGVSYLDILKSGGGIMATVRAVRAASRAELASALRRRLGIMLREGSTTIEVKSGYGLSTADELKMLWAIKDAASGFAGSVVITALIGHAIDAGFAGGPERFVAETIGETLPAIHAAFPGVAIDAYCETGAWNVEDCVRLCEAARDLGHPLRIHADQFNSMGMVAHALRLGARSIDHLEASTDLDLLRIAQSPTTYAGVLPICGLHLDDRYARARRFLDAAPTSKLYIATNLNPGSAPCPSMAMAIAVAVRKCGISPGEAIAAATVNPACMLGLPDRGIIAPGARADLLLLRHTDERQLAYEFGASAVETVICGGQIVDPAASTG